MSQPLSMQQPVTDAQPQTLAAVDLGSNSFHMIVCRVQHDQLVIVDRLREPVRLAAGIDKDNNLTAEAQTQALACLTRFAQRLGHLPAHCIRIVGTNTLRCARNAAQFIQAAELCLGHPIEIISGMEEARLIYLGVAHHVASDKNRRLVIDIGGGSTELIVGEEFSPLRMESLDMGCVSMSRRFFANGELSPKAIKAAEIAAMQELEIIVAPYTKLKWQTAIGASGSIRAIDRIITACGWSNNGITREALKQLVNRLRETPHVTQLNLPELEADRAWVLPGGVMILYAAFKALKIDNLRVSDGALREGVIHDLLGRLHHTDVRSASVNALARRYHADSEQAERIHTTAQDCFNQVVETWHLDDSSWQWLEWAISLHEIGLDISHSQYQKHGAYVIDHADLAGFSKQEQQFLATLILAHRRKFPEKEIKALPANSEKTAKRLAILLRLTVLLHRSRSTEPLPPFTITAKGKTITLQFPAQWLGTHPLTEADLQQEARFLQEADFSLVIPNA